MRRRDFIFMLIKTKSTLLEEIERVGFDDNYSNKLIEYYNKGIEYEITDNTIRALNYTVLIKSIKYELPIRNLSSNELSMYLIEIGKDKNLSSGDRSIVFKNDELNSDCIEMLFELEFLYKSMFEESIKDYKVKHSLGEYKI